MNFVFAMKGILKLESVFLLACALLVSSCGADRDIPSAADSALPGTTHDSGPKGPESGEGELLTRPGDMTGDSGQPQ